jgi:hypothetical protein
LFGSENWHSVPGTQWLVIPRRRHEATWAMIGLAAGTLDEAGFAGWRRNIGRESGRR